MTGRSYTGAMAFELASMGLEGLETVVPVAGPASWYGGMDLRAPEAGFEPSTAVRREEPIAVDTWYDYTLYLQPAYYTVPAGHRLELYVVPFCGFSDDAALYDSSSQRSSKAWASARRSWCP